MQFDWQRVESAAKQAQENGEQPLCAYIYDLAALARHAHFVRASLPGACDFFYAIKANSDLPLLNTLAPYVDGFEASSGGEIAWIRQHFPVIPLLLSGPGKLDDELALALRENVTVHVESLHELERLGVLSSSMQTPGNVLLRLNPPLAEMATTSLVMGGKPTQFGIALELLPACLRCLKRYPRLQLQGIHLHLMSHQLDAACHLQLMATYIRQCRQWCAVYGMQIEHINAGGGIGVNYRQPHLQFEWAAFCRGLTELLSSEQAAAGGALPRLRFEMGRFVSAFCGYYATEVIDLKQSGDKTYAIVRGGTHHFRTPYAQGHSHPLRVVRQPRWERPYARPQVHSSVITVAGQLCTPKDVLASDVKVDCLSAGDLLLFPYAGAYAWHISHHDFLRHPHPQHIYLPAQGEALSESIQ